MILRPDDYEILFRGKRVDNDEFVEGYIVKMFGALNIMKLDDETTVYPVIPKTVGQYTGKKDKNDNKIFDRDIVKTKYGRLCIVVISESDSHIGWDMFPVATRENLEKKPPDKFDLWNPQNLEIVGNIHKNPELL